MPTIAQQAILRCALVSGPCGVNDVYLLTKVAV